MAGDQKTEELTGPASAPQSVRGRPVLITVFPVPRVLPLPVLHEPVGRDWLQGFNVVDPKVSRAHLVFDRDGGVLHVKDNGSSNGTWLNGVRLQFLEANRIQDGDVLRAGRSIFIYRERFIGTDLPAPPLGELVAPFGLARERLELDHILSRTPSNVLIRGETGTGKELIAAEIANRVGRGKNYVAVNVAGIAPTVFESQLFGHEKGAFTGADRASDGIFLSHNRGAVFLDEIGDLAFEQQARLLRLLENREVMPVGAKEPKKVDVVVIAATHRNLEEIVSAGRFREDLLARFTATTKPNTPNTRREDIFAIACAAVAKHWRAYEPAEVEPEALEQLLLHDWPTNVRELMSAVDRLASAVPPPKLAKWAVEKLLGPVASRPAPSSSEIDRRFGGLQRKPKRSSTAPRD